MQDENRMDVYYMHRKTKVISTNIDLIQRVEITSLHERWHPVLPVTVGMTPAAVAHERVLSIMCVATACPGQVMAAAPGGSQLSAGLLARQIWQREGLSGLFGGLSARVLSIAPGCAISWLLYENIKKRL